jgi:hypothetical protein
MRLSTAGRGTPAQLARVPRHFSARRFRLYYLRTFIAYSHVREPACLPLSQPLLAMQIITKFTAAIDVFNGSGLYFNGSGRYFAANLSLSHFLSAGKL